MHPATVYCGFQTYLDDWMMRAGHIGFAAPNLFRSTKHLIAAESRCSPSHDFRHGGLHSHMPGACGLHRGVAGRAVQEKTKFADLGVSVIDNSSRRIKL